MQDKFLIGFTGAQGSGKSTILASLDSLGVPVKTGSLSRAAQKALGWSSLDKVHESPNNMWDLQEAILASMQARDETLSKEKQLIHVDRTPADLWAYTVEWCRSLKIHPDDAQVCDYKSRCLQLLQQYYKYVCFVWVDDRIPFIAEPERASIWSRERVEISALSILNKSGVLIQYVTALSVADRTAQAKAWYDLALAQHIEG